MSGSKNEIEAITISEFGGYLVTDDKAQALFKFHSGETEFTLAYPAEHLSSLVKAVTASQAQVRARPKMDEKTPVQAFPVDWFEIGKASNDAVVLSLRLDGGGTLSFALPTGMVPQMIEAFQAATGTSIPPKPGTSLS